MDRQETRRDREGRRIRKEDSKVRDKLEIKGDKKEGIYR